MKLEGKRKFIVLGAFLIALVVSTISFFALKKDNVQMTAEDRRAMNYEMADNGAIDGTEFVTFNAFFLRDLNQDGYAESILGTCKPLGSEDTLYMELRVLTDGVLENGKIEINGDNFYFKTETVSDRDAKKSYVGENIKKIEFNTIETGTQKLIYGVVRNSIRTEGGTSVVKDNINKFNSKNNTVVLTGTHVASDGTKTDIRKEIKLEVDWYGGVKTHISSSITSQPHSLSDLIQSEQEIVLEAEVGASEENNQVPLKSSIVKGSIPQLSGYDPLRVECESTLVDFVYDTSTREFTLTRSSTLNDDGTISNPVSRSNYYNLKIIYPREAYLAIGGDAIAISIPIEATYEGHNNANEEFENPVTSTEHETIGVSYRNPVGYNARVYVRVGELEYDPIDHKTQYLVSKLKPNAFYANVNLPDNNKDTYYVTWRAETGTQPADAGFVITNDPNAYNDQFGVYQGAIDMSKYSKNIGISFRGTVSMLGSNGWIEVYNNDTGELIHRFEGEELTKYSKGKEYMYTQPIDHIKIVTSKYGASADMYIYHLKEMDDVLLNTDFTKEEFDELESINSNVIGYMIYDDKTTEKLNSELGGAKYRLPISYATISVSPDWISSQEECEDFEITIKANDYGDFYSNWQNGTFLVKIPDEITEFKINSVTHTSNIEIDSYEICEIDGHRFVRIYTSNDVSCYPQITIDAKIAADPMVVTCAPEFELYAYNSINNNYGESLKISDIYDLNNDGNLQEDVSYCKTDLRIISPTTLVTSQEITEFDKIGSKVVSSQVGEISINDNIEKFKVNLRMLNNYSNTVSEVKIVGRILFEGNKYQLNKKEMGSEFDTFMTDPILIPDELKDIATIYYSNKELVTNDLSDPKNEWTTTPEDLSLVKSYMIDLGDFEIPKGGHYDFAYYVALDYDTVKLNEVAYTDHAIYFALHTSEGKYLTSVEPAKLGVKVIKKFNLELNKIEAGTEDKYISNTLFKVVDESTKEARTAFTNLQGKANFADLYLDKYYTIREIRSNEDYSLDTHESKIRVYADENEEIKIDVISGDAINTSVDNNTATVSLTYEDELKYNLELRKYDETSNELLEGIKFMLNGGGFINRIFATDKNGTLSVTGLVPGVEYTISEYEANGYYIKDGSVTFRVNRVGENLELQIISGSFVNQPTFGTKTDGDNRPTMSIDFPNIKIPTYNVELIKVQADTENPIKGVIFELSGSNKRTTTYTTGEDGKISLSNFFVFDPAKDVEADYTLKEIYAPAGYTVDETPINFSLSENASGELVVDKFDRADVSYSVDQATRTLKIVYENEAIFTIHKIDADTKEPMSNVSFSLFSNELGQEIGGDGQPIRMSENVTEVSIAENKIGPYGWELGEDDIWRSTNQNMSSTTSKMRTAFFNIAQGAQIKVEATSSSESGFDYVEVNIVNEAGKVLYSENIAANSFNTEEDIPFEEFIMNSPVSGKVALEFLYRKDGSVDSNLDTGYVKNKIQIGTIANPLQVTDENGNIKLNLGEGFYQLVETSVVPGYKENKKIYKFGIGKSSEPVEQLDFVSSELTEDLSDYRIGYYYKSESDTNYYENKYDRYYFSDNEYIAERVEKLEPENANYYYTFDTSDSKSYRLPNGEVLTYDKYYNRNYIFKFDKDTDELLDYAIIKGDYNQYAPYADLDEDGNLYLGYEFVGQKSTYSHQGMESDFINELVNATESSKESVNIIKLDSNFNLLSSYIQPTTYYYNSLYGMKYEDNKIYFKFHTRASNGEFLVGEELVEVPTYFYIQEELDKNLVLQDYMFYEKNELFYDEDVSNTINHLYGMSVYEKMVGKTLDGYTFKQDDVGKILLCMNDNDNSMKVIDKFKMGSIKKIEIIKTHENKYAVGIIADKALVTESGVNYTSKVDGSLITVLLYDKDGIFIGNSNIIDGSFENEIYLNCNNDNVEINFYAYGDAIYFEDDTELEIQAGNRFGYALIDSNSLEISAINAFPTEIEGLKKISDNRYMADYRFGTIILDENLNVVANVEIEDCDGIRKFTDCPILFEDGSIAFILTRYNGYGGGAPSAVALLSDTTTPSGMNEKHFKYANQKFAYVYDNGMSEGSNAIDKSETFIVKIDSEGNVQFVRNINDLDREVLYYNNHISFPYENYDEKYVREQMIVDKLEYENGQYIVYGITNANYEISDSGYNKIVYNAFLAPEYPEAVFVEVENEKTKDKTDLGHSIAINSPSYYITESDNRVPTYYEYGYDFKPGIITGWEEIDGLIEEKKENLTKAELYNLLSKYNVGKYLGNVCIEHVEEGKDSKEDIRIVPKIGYGLLGYGIAYGEYEGEYFNNSNFEQVSILSQLQLDRDGGITLDKFENVNNCIIIEPIFFKTNSYVIVNHYIKGTTEKVADSDYIPGYPEAEYTTRPVADLEKYELEKDAQGEYVIPSNAAGVMENEPIIVNYYYEPKKPEIIVHHYLNGSEIKLAEDETFDVEYGQNYTTSQAVAPNIDPRYKLVGHSDNIEGTIVDKKTEVIYYYELTRCNITTEVIGGHGQITGEGQTPYESVLYGEDSVKDIVALADPGYTMDSIWINGELFEEFDMQQLIDEQYWTAVDGNNPDEYSEVNLLNKFSNVTEDIHVQVHYAIDYYTLRAYKEWDDDNNSAGKRPGTIELDVYNGNKLLSTNTIDKSEVPKPQDIDDEDDSESNYWFKTLRIPMIDENGNYVKVTDLSFIERETNPGDLLFYKSTINPIYYDMGDGTYNLKSIEIINTYTIPDALQQITVTKVWEDNDDIYAKRPESVKFQIKNGDTVVREVTMEGAQNTISQIVYNLPVFDSETGEEIVYTIDEVEVNENDLKFYTKAIDNDTYTITNTFTVPEDKIDLEVTKKWEDNSNANGVRPQKIKLTIFADGVKAQEKEVNTTADNECVYTFTDLAKYNASGNEIVYTVEEADVEGYSKNVEGLTVTNTILSHNITTEVIGVGGQISGNKENPYETVTHGGDSVKNITMIPDTGYEISRITINGEEQELPQDPTIPRTLEQFENVTEDIHITVEYKLREYKITTEVIGGHGQITGEGQTPYETVIHGNNSVKDIVCTPDHGYKITSITVNGETITFTPNDDQTYMLDKFVNMTEDKHIIVRYELRETSIIIKHQTEDGTDLVNPETRNGLVGDEYKTEPKDFDNYDVKVIPANKDGNMTVEQIEVIYIYSKVIGSVKVTKIDSTTDDVIEGATFRLEKLDDEGFISDDFTPVEITTDEDGIALFENLEVGEYQVTEIKAPEGYELMNKVEKVEVTKAKRDVEIRAANRPQFALPMTGAINYTIGIVGIGIIAVVSSFILLKKKEEKEEA